MRHRIYRQKVQSYWSIRITENKCQPKKLWQTFSNLLGRNTRRKSGFDYLTAQQLLEYFNEKVASVRNSTGNCDCEPTTVLPPAAVELDRFNECSMEDVRKIITSGTSKTCALDPLPTSTVKQFLPELLPYVTAMCNSSLGLSSSESTPCHRHSASEEAECRPGGREKLPADLESDIYV